jgi:hypothetical protein
MYRLMLSAQIPMRAAIIGPSVLGRLTKPARDRISATKFAFPKQRKEPLENASHVRNAVARFKQLKGGRFGRGPSCGMEVDTVCCGKANQVSHARFYCGFCSLSGFFLASERT